MLGIVGYGGYVPRLRLQRATIAAFNAWAHRAGGAAAQGERSMCNWDEDAVTMAVEAARDCLIDRSRDAVGALYLASTSLPFADRQNATIVAGWLNLRTDIRTLDATSSQRAGTSALIGALAAAATTAGGVTLHLSSEHRRTASGAAAEPVNGDGAAALLLGDEDVIATLVGSHTVSVDFVDHYRGQSSAFDYDWEERWVRDEGYMKLVPQAVAGVLAETGVSATDVNHFLAPCANIRTTRAIMRRIGLPEDCLADSLVERCGWTGSAHPALMLAHVLEIAQPGQRVLVVGVGQGCDALLFEVTPQIEKLPRRRGVSRALAWRKPETNYGKFLQFNGLIDADLGKRAELKKLPVLSALYRHRSMLASLVGGRCRQCGTVQFPKAHYCINPNCDGLDTQDDHPFADTPAAVQSWTADYATFTPAPPACYGMVRFDGGGQFMADFTDVDGEELEVGTRMRMMFRIHDLDDARSFRRYFWKAAPEPTAAEEEA